jgi:hypothetical protein
VLALLFDVSCDIVAPAPAYVGVQRSADETLRDAQRSWERRLRDCEEGWRDKMAAAENSWGEVCCCSQPIIHVCQLGLDRLQH